MKVFLLLALIAVAASHHVNFPEEDESQWELFKIEHEKVYSNEVEEHSRKEIFMRNLNFIRQHNAKYDNGEVSFRVGINRFADMTNQEFSKKMKGYKMPEGFVSEGDKFELDETLDLPKSVDWRTKGAVTPIKDQGQCGSCWAFSATGALEGQNFLKTKKMVSLSEQNLVDCSKENFGCYGGYIEKAFTFVKDNKGIDTEVSYPYEAHHDTCHFNKTTIGGTCTGYTAITSGSEKALQQAVATVGPVSVAIDANTDTFQFYESGVYWEPDCDPTFLDHAVLAIGYGTSKRGRDYWLVKNSWGTGWGMKGFILMSRNRKNMCGIATAASYPTV